jgi:RNA polymerase sigma-70 factor (ECF subfamily)
VVEVRVSTTEDGSARGPLPPDADLVAGLRAGAEATFAMLLDAWSPGLLRTARAYVASSEAAEDVVQETWLAVIRGVDRFEGRSSLRTWVYRILVNIAKTHGVKDSRTITWSSLSGDEDTGPTVDPGRFQGPDEPYPGHWRRFPDVWPSPESEAVRREARAMVDAAIAGLPHRQRVVITLRDVDGYSSEEVCSILDITAANQRVLLHRARAAVRQRLEDYFTNSGAGVLP